MKILFIAISILFLTSCKKEKIEIVKNEFDLKIETNTGYTYDTNSPWSWQSMLQFAHSDINCQVYINNKLVNYEPNLTTIFFKIKKGDFVFVKSGFASNPKLLISVDDKIDFSDSCKSTWPWVLNDPGFSTDTIQIEKLCEVAWSKQF